MAAMTGVPSAATVETAGTEAMVAMAAVVTENSPGDEVFCILWYIL